MLKERKSIRMKRKKIKCKSACGWWYFVVAHRERTREKWERKWQHFDPISQKNIIERKGRKNMMREWKRFFSSFYSIYFSNDNTFFHGMMMVFKLHTFLQTQTLYKAFFLLIFFSILGNGGHVVVYNLSFSNRKPFIHTKHILHTQSLLFLLSPFLFQQSSSLSSSSLLWYFCVPYTFITISRFL